MVYPSLSPFLQSCQARASVSGFVSLALLSPRASCLALSLTRGNWTQSQVRKPPTPLTRPAHRTVPVWHLRSSNTFDRTAGGPPQTRRGHSRRWTAALCAVLAFLIPAKELRGSHGAFQVTQATPERAGWTSLGALRLRSPASGTLRVRAHSRVSPSHQRRRGRSKFFSGPACTVLQNHRKVGPGAC